MDAKQIRENLKKQRSQKFRSQSDKKIDAINKMAYDNKQRWDDPEFKQRMLSYRDNEWHEKVAISNKKRMRNSVSIQKIKDNQPAAHSAAILPPNETNWLIYSSISELADFYNIITWKSDPSAYFPKDGSIKFIHKGSFKGYLLRRVIHKDPQYVHPETKILFIE